MPLAVLHQHFDDPDWIFENKYDGFRALAYVENRAVRLVSRKRNVYKSFPGLCSALADCLPVRDAVLDGEIVHLDAAGKPQFMPLLHRRSPQHFVAFDLLWLNGKDLTRMPLVERKGILRSIVPVGAPVIYADHVDGAGRELYGAVCEVDMEGIVAKQKDGRYTPPATTWAKIKNPNYSQAEGRRELFEKRRATVGT